jgi:glycosyltransferase involved in cell wall biosynthesis
MKILFITHYFSPHIGGVEKHVQEVAKSLERKGNSVVILTEKYDKLLKDTEIVDGIKVVRFSYPHIKFLGIKFIWWQIFRNRKLIKDADVVHIHDVFVWYLPFRFLYPAKRVYTTFHGWEGKWPIPFGNILQKRLAVRLSSGTIAVGKYIEKYYGIKTNKIIYGGI